MSPGHVAACMTVSVVAAMVFPQKAAAWLCASAAGYAEPGFIYEWLPTDQIPTPMWPSGDPGACSDVPPPVWCDSNLAMAPGGQTDTGPLVLWLPGKGNEPKQNEIILKTAAYAGYRTLGLAFDNLEKTRADWCDVDYNGTLFQGGFCDDGCQFTTGFEMLDGVDDLTTPYPAHRMRSIRGRLSLALHDLYRHDLVDDGSNDLEWDDFCSYDPVDGTIVDYDQMIVSGFSAGGQMAQFISYVEPVVGLVAIEAGADYCELDASDTSTVGYPDEYEEHGTYPPCGDAVAECDPDERRVALHRDTAKIYGILGDLTANLQQVGIDPVDYDVDPDLDTGLQPDFSSNNLFSTQHDIPGGCTAHTSMAVDGCMSTAAGTATDEVDPLANDAYLFPALLQAYCDVGP